MIYGMEWLVANKTIIFFKFKKATHSIQFFHFMSSFYESIEWNEIDEWKKNYYNKLNWMKYWRMKYGMKNEESKWNECDENKSYNFFFISTTHSFIP